jgi:tagatose-6-phosphate ketose/aldose isomerase
MKGIELFTEAGGHVAKEISGQPGLWERVYKLVYDEKDKLTNFLDDILKINDLQIILSGAGSSAFVGEILQQSFHINTGIPATAIATTDLVTHPEGFFKKSTPTLLISIARSGDSPESVATFELAEKFLDVVYHLVITCNKEGNLAKKGYARKNSFVFALPPEANDQALAMTGSFTSMALAGLLISDIKNIANHNDNVNTLIKCGQSVLTTFITRLKEVACIDFKRVVFLGSGTLKGAAKESHLKLLEMTDGQIVCQNDSFLGFRHGPRAAIDRSTLIVYLFSSDPYVFSYEADLVKSINRTENFRFSIGIGQCISTLENLDVNMTIDLCCENKKIPDDFFSICAVLPAQVIGFYKSVSLGLTPDFPSQKGGINRIVQGVTIYPY